jgi:cell division septation protein DedD
LEVENAKGQKRQEVTHFIEPHPLAGSNHTPVTADAADALQTETTPVVVSEAPPGEQTPATVKASAGKNAVERVQRTKSGPLPTERPKVEPTKSEAPKSKQTSPEPSSGGPSGTYLQLVATSKLEAEIIVDGLRQKRFESLAVEILGKGGTYRVLVGPVRDGNVNKLRADLRDAGFPGDRAIRRTF